MWHIDLEAKGGFARALHRAFLVGFQVTLGIFQYKQGIFLLNVPRVASAIYKEWSSLRGWSIFDATHPWFYHEVLRFVCLKRSYFLQVFLCSVRKEQQQIAKAEFYNILLSLLMKSDYNISC